MTARRPSGRRGAARFAPVSAEPAGYLLFAVWYFRLNAVLAGVQTLAAIVAGPPVDTGVRALTAVFGAALVALYLWIAHLLARRRRLGAYITLVLMALSLLGALFGDGGLFALVIPVLGLAVAFGAWRELEADVRTTEREGPPTATPSAHPAPGSP